MVFPPPLLLAPAVLMTTGLLQTAALTRQCPRLPQAVMTGMITEPATGAIGMTLVIVVLTITTIATPATIVALILEGLWIIMIVPHLADMTLLEISSHSTPLVQVDGILQTAVTTSNRKDLLIKLHLLVIPAQLLVLLLLLPAQLNINVLLTTWFLISTSPQNRLQKILQDKSPPFRIVSDPCLANSNNRLEKGEVILPDLELEETHPWTQFLGMTLKGSVWKIVLRLLPQLYLLRLHLLQDILLLL
jgi:hypothetical protein